MPYCSSLSDSIPPARPDSKGSVSAKGQSWGADWGAESSHPARAARTGQAAEHEVPALISELIPGPAPAGLRVGIPLGDARLRSAA